MARSHHDLGDLAQRRGDYPAAEAFYGRALEIFERLGDQYSMAGSYHELGTLAQRRSDYSAAETLYRQALDTFERLGNQDGMATVYSSLAAFSETVGNSSEAVSHWVFALASRVQMNTPAGEEIHALSELRRTLGRECFQTSLPPGIDEKSREALTQTLDEWDTHG
jgi:tetratricopeptide (TPR) repeat protein